MCRGRASRLEEAEEKCRTLECLMRVQTGGTHRINEQMAEAVCVIRVDVDSYTAKAHE